MLNNKNNGELEQVLNQLVDESEEKRIKQLDEKNILIDGQKFKIIKNKNQALDLDQFEEKYTDFFEKFDFIVGDLGYDKLRLRGFYYDQTEGVPLDMRISTLEDYLLEYCNFGCDYFVLERLEDKTVFPDYRKKKRPSRKKQKHKTKAAQPRHKSKKSFQKRKGVEGKKKIKERLKKEKVKEVEIKKANKSFQIKKKK